MKRTPKITLLLFSFALLALRPTKADIQRYDTSESMSGLKGIFIVSQLIDVQPEGLTKASVEKIIKAALETNGVPLDSEPNKFHGDANLSVTINTIKQDQLGIYAFTVEVAVMQTVKLSRLPNASPVSARTWSRTIQGLTTPDRVDVIEQALKKGLDQFIVSYRSVNSQTGKTNR
jgi:hypothetical protein